MFATPTWLTGAVVVLLFDGALLSFGNGALTVSLATLVSKCSFNRDFASSPQAQLDRAGVV